MYRLMPILLCACLISLSVARADDDEDKRQVCPVISAELLQKIIPLVKGKGERCQTSCTGCGCKGGPGYRAADAKCVGYADLIAKCGPPPHRGCRRECALPAKECVVGRVWLKAVAASAGLALTFIEADPPEDRGKQPSAIDPILQPKVPAGKRPATAPLPP